MFNAGSRRSYFSKEFAEKIGYESYEKPREIMLAMKNKTTDLVGRTIVYRKLRVIS